MAMLNNQRVTFWGLEWNSSWILDLCDTKWSKFSIVFSDLRTCVFHRQELPRQTPLFFGIHWHPHLSGPFFRCPFTSTSPFFSLSIFRFLGETHMFVASCEIKKHPQYAISVDDVRYQRSWCSSFSMWTIPLSEASPNLSPPLKTTRAHWSHETWGKPFVLPSVSKAQTSSYIIIKSPWNAS